MSDSLLEANWVMNSFSEHDIEICIQVNNWLAFYSNIGVEFNLAVNQVSQNPYVRVPGYSIAVMLNFVHQELPYGVVSAWRRLATGLGCSASRVFAGDYVKCITLDGIDLKVWPHWTAACIAVMVFAQGRKCKLLKGVKPAGLKDTHLPRR